MAQAASAHELAPRDTIHSMVYTLVVRAREMKPRKISGRRPAKVKVAILLEMVPTISLGRV